MSVELNERRQKLLAGGGEERVAKQHEAGKMTARERVAKLYRIMRPFNEFITEGLADFKFDE